MAADYSMTASLLSSRNISSSVSEIHGVLSGQVCADSTQFDPVLSQKILEIEGGLEEVITNLLKMLAEDIKADLGAGDYAFHPLLPDDETGISSRLAALADWCDGFNAGFAGAWVRDDAAMAAETREVLSDFANIAEVDRETGELSTRENEVNYMEIVEYVRMAAITVYLQNAPEGTAIGGLELPPADDNIH